jgi:SAM-dependent methyltransferase
MEENAYRQFIELEQHHFWFVARRRIFFHLLDYELGGRTGLRVLDVGCGAGGMLGPLARYGHVTGVEPAADLVEHCRERGFGDVVEASAYDLPTASESMDLVTLFDTLEHIEDDLRALRECRRALAPGGLLFLSSPAYQFLYANNDRVAAHARRYTARELRRKLRATGFESVRVTYFNTLLFPAILPVVLAKKVQERFAEPGDSTNLSMDMPPALNRALAAVMSSERRVLTRTELPFGHSVIALARRPSGNGAG